MSASLNELSLEDLKEIITRPKNAISKQYKALFSFEGVEFEITEDGREQIAQLAVEKKIGARGLRSIMEKLLLDCMYDIPDKDSVDKVVLSKESVISNRPIIVYKEKAKIKHSVQFRTKDYEKNYEDRIATYEDGILDSHFWATRYDYLRIAKAMLDDWQNDTCVGKYLKTLWENRVDTENDKRRKEGKKVSWVYASGSVSYTHLTLPTSDLV